MQLLREVRNGVAKQLSELQRGTRQTSETRKITTDRTSNMNRFNFYEDSGYADAYSKLEFPGTYYLAYRDLPQIIAKHVEGNLALDFGCGAGRSSRFLRQLGFEVTGVDISAEMLKKAREKDPGGDYRLIADGDLSGLHSSSYDLVLSAFTFDNVPDMNRKIQLIRSLCSLLKPAGRMVNLVSAPEIYLHEWECFSTRDFPENRVARSGDQVRIVNRAIEDARPVVDILMSDDAYRDVYSKAGVHIVESYRPLAKKEEPFQWVNETRISPWVIYVLTR
jgi:SAM-dependent methyltransferase